MLSDGDIGQLLAPVSEEAPTGENLEYDASFSELERVSAGKEERYSGGELIPAEEPEWRMVHELAVALFARTKDLRVAVQLAKAETAQSGIAGLQVGMHLMRALLEQRPDLSEHLQFAILQTWPVTLTASEVIDHEIRHKTKLGSRAHGLNSN